MVIVLEPARLSIWIYYFKKLHYRDEDYVKEFVVTFGHYRAIGVSGIAAEQ
jgi:hypothetical protein